MPAWGHDRGTSYSTWTLRGRDATVVLRIADLEITRFPWASEPEAALDRVLSKYFTSNLQLLAGGEPCAVARLPRALASPPGQRSYEWQISCPGKGALSIRSRLMFEVSPAHLHFARVSRDGGKPLERVLSEREDTWELSDDKQASPHASSVLDYIKLGIKHILSGTDHLAFVAALLLLATSLAEVARIVTGFTIAHSITLALMALGYITPQSGPIEALIGLSIALVAAENSWKLSQRGRGIPIAITGALCLAAIAGHSRVPAMTLAGLALFSACYFELLPRVARPMTLRWGIAFLFGLVHGFGFASVLGDAGLPPDRIVSALLGFNLGVELGQLFVIALFFPLLQLLARRRAAAHRWFVEAASAGVFAVGLYWFLVRSFG